MSAGGGWFAVYRSIFKTYEGDAEALAAWIWILANTRFQGDGELDRGEVRLSIRALARQMGWTKSKAERFRNRLIREGQIVFVGRDANRDTYRDTYGNTFRVVKYDVLQPSRLSGETPTGTPTGTLYKKVEEGKKDNGVAVAPKSEGGDAAPRKRPATKKKPAARKSRSEQRDYLAELIRKAEAGK